MLHLLSVTHLSFSCGQAKVKTNGQFVCCPKCGVKFWWPSENVLNGHDNLIPW